MNDTCDWSLTSMPITMMPIARVYPSGKYPDPAAPRRPLPQATHLTAAITRLQAYAPS